MSFPISNYFTNVPDFEIRRANPQSQARKTIWLALYVGGGGEGEGALGVISVGGSRCSDSDCGIWGDASMAGLTEQ
jgi:hypothetical protein